MIVIIESVAEKAVIDWFGKLGYERVLGSNTAL